jgi:hypothetical protein
MPNEISGLEPLTLTILETQHVTGESRSQIYARLGNGEYQAVKSGLRTLILYESVKRRIAALPPATLPPAKIKPPKPRSSPASRRPQSRSSGPGV